MRRLLSCLAATAAVLAVSPRASANATLMTGLGGTVGYGPTCMPPCDDGYWPNNTTGLDLTPAFPSGLHFYNGTYTHGWINNNGSLSFSGGITTFTPDAFPGAPQPMIAPYWGDVDTRRSNDSWTVPSAGSDSCGDGRYPVGGSYPAGDSCHNPTTDGVWWSITPGQVVITWDHVGVFDCQWSSGTPGIEMTFQMILSAATACGGSSGMDFDIEFRYAECGWEAGTASGGATGGFCPTPSTGCTPAQAGFDSAQTPDTNYASLPDSRMVGVSTELCTQSNLTPPQPGVWQFIVRGGSIMCPTAGQACQTGMQGVCADGQLTCGVSGQTTCTPLTPAGPTQCNGLDNNCDGVVDTGPCPTGTVCDGTACVPACLEGGCPSGQTCTSGGVCVETDCVNVTCPSGERCVGGSCVDACSGITCPINQVCRLGNCVDPCANLNCGMGQVCENGTCVPSCPCTACTSSQTCETSGPDNGKCVPTDCATVTCPTGEVCQAGACISACTGAVCPQGQTCTNGNCVATSSGDAGTDGGGLHLDGGLGDASFSFDGSSGDDASGGDDGGPDDDFGGAKSGCSCRATGDTGSEGWLAALGVGVAFVGSRWRRRGRGASARR